MFPGIRGSINWSAVAAAGKQFAIVRIGSSNNNGAYVDPYFLQNVNGAHAAGLRVGAYYYTYARTESAVAGGLTTFLNALEGLQLEYPVFVDVEARSLTSLGKPQLTNLVKYAMDIFEPAQMVRGLVQLHQLHQLVYECFRAGKLSALGGGLPLSLGYTGRYGMWQYSGSGTVSGITGAVDLDYSYQDYLPTIRAGNFNGYGSDGPDMTAVSRYKLTVFGSNTEYFLYRQSERCGGLPAAGQLPGHPDHQGKIQRVRLGRV